MQKVIDMFCPDCGNFLTTQRSVDDEGQIKDDVSFEDVCQMCNYSIEKLEFLEDVQAKTTVNTKNIQHNMTYLRTRLVKCQKQECQGTEVLFFKHKTHLMFVCADEKCSHTWTSYKKEIAEAFDANSDAEDDDDHAYTDTAAAAGEEEEEEDTAAAAAAAAGEENDDYEGIYNENSEEED